jgi:acetyl esterase/lipase
MKRRTLIRHAAASAALILLSPLFIASAAPTAAPDVAPTVIPLWEGTPPGGGGPSGAPERTAKGALSNVVTPQLEVFVPAKPNGTAAVIAGGGGYKRIQMENESYPAARWLAERGVTAFVLSYRLPAEGWRDGPLAPLQDAQRAIRLVRANAHRYGIDPERILALGFSAGGHLMGMAAARSGFQSYAPRDAVDAYSAHVAAAALAYPVITLLPPYDHTSTRRVLVGDHPTTKESAEWSVESWIRPGTPPLFAVQAADDPISDPVNLTILTDAATRAGVAIDAHRLSSGGHGFGMGKPGTPSAEWPSWFEHWLRQRGLIG